MSSLGELKGTRVFSSGLLDWDGGCLDFPFLRFLVDLGISEAYTDINQTAWCLILDQTSCFM